MDSTVVSAAHGVLGPLLGKLADLLVGKFGRVRGVRSDILSLQSELTVMHAALKNYTMLEDPDVQVKAWISLLRELAYDTEDCVDKFIRRLGKKRRHRGFKDFLRRTARALKTLNSRCGIANRIDELKARIKHVKELKDSYKLSDTTCTTTRHEAVDPRLQALFAEEARLVGVEGPRDDLAKWIIKKENNTTNCKVLSIVGFAGLGKTTLANEVYRKIQGHFDCHAFISVSQKPVIKKIIIDVISQVSFQDGSTKDTGDWNEIKCIAKLRELLQDKRYLIIIDDIWSTQAWDTIQCAFPENNCSNRIIATTRIVDVARSCCSGGHDRVFHMEALSDIHSRRLFFTRIFGSEDHCPDMLKEVSVEILNKCGGMPLAIISISGFLANIPAVKDEWEKIKRSIGSALEKERSLEGMRNILLLSYNDLPPNLKTCLLYLSVFPEDYVISRKRLVRRWIAEGFISEERGLSRQEVAESYFYELINKSMIQPVYIGDDGKARACRVHDIMLEIIISKSSEDNFITVVGGGQTIFSRCHGFIRRLSIQHIDQELASALANEDLSHVRSLTVTTPGCIRHLPGLVKFKALRVLDFTYCEGLEEYIMKGMDKLFQLKYFRLEGRGISTLPSGIVTLGNLETLDLRYTSVLELPAKIDQLTKLEHVLAEGDTKIPNGIGNMRNLQVISGFNITLSPTDVVEDLGNLARLDELNVGLDGGGSGEYTRHEEMLLSSLCKLGTSKLRSLHITRRDGSLEFLNSWFPLPFSLQICHMASFYYFTNVPKWIAPTLTNLVDLLICLTDLKEGLHTLGELPALLCVELWWKTTPNDRVTVQGVGFPSLKKFVLRSREGACIAFVKGAMPKLEKLRMPLNVLVARTHDFYLGIEHLPCLKEVSVWIARVGATSSTRKVAADAVRKEVGAHTNHPMVKFVMRSDEHDIEETAHYEEKSKEDNDTAGN